MPAAADLAEDYVVLGLDLGRHLPGLVDSYVGPPHLAARAAVGRPVAPPVLVARARTLLADLHEDGHLAPGRRRWLAGQAGGLLRRARSLAGEPCGYLEEVEDCYGVRPAEVPEEELDAAHRSLDAALPGAGGVGARVLAWRAAQAVSPGRTAAAATALLELLRARTAEVWGLPAGEEVELDLVGGRPWGALHRYLGGLRSRVAIGADPPLGAAALAHLLAHEAYPGHHTEHCRKDVALLRPGQVEESISLLSTPRCTVSEGLAEVALGAALGPRPEGAVAEALRPLGLRLDSGTAAAVADATATLRAVRTNVALGLHVRGWSPERAAAYLERWGPSSPSGARRQVRWLLDTRWRAHAACYAEGARLCRAYVAGDPARFARLLDEQLLPADLAAGGGDAAAGAAAP